MEILNTFACLPIFINSSMPCNRRSLGMICTTASGHLTVDSGRVRRVSSHGGGETDYATAIDQGGAINRPELLPLRVMIPSLSRPLCLSRQSFLLLWSFFGLL